MHQAAWAKSPHCGTCHHFAPKAGRLLPGLGECRHHEAVTLINRRCDRHESCESYDDSEPLDSDLGDGLVGHHPALRVLPELAIPTHAEPSPVRAMLPHDRSGERSRVVCLHPAKLRLPRVSKLTSEGLGLQKLIERGQTLTCHNVEHEWLAFQLASRLQCLKRMVERGRPSKKEWQALCDVLEVESGEEYGQSSA